jgi:transposase
MVAADRVGAEVISVVERRRRWTMEQKLALVDLAAQPGSSVAATADRHGVSRSLLFDWRRQVREGIMPGVVSAEPGASFAPVRIVPAQQSPLRSSAAASPGRRLPVVAAMMELVLTNGRVLRVSQTIKPELLGQLAAVLES